MEKFDSKLNCSRSSWALVTGASSGIGQQIAVRLAKIGFRIIVNHFNDPSGADKTLRLAGLKSEPLALASGAMALASGALGANNTALAPEASANGSQETPFSSGHRLAGADESCGRIFGADVGAASEVASMFQEIRDRGQQLEVLVNNAGVQTFASILDLRPEDWERTIRTNLTGSFLCTQQAARLMQSSGGRIINIGSGANRVPFPNLVDYCSSKGGIEMLTKVSAVELGKFGISVNCIAPGAIENERTQRESPGYAETWGSITPLGRCGTMIDVADAVELLVSDKARFITGQTLYVDGGLWTRGQWPYES